MDNNPNSILIKSRNGQFKVVDLNLPQQSGFITKKEKIVQDTKVQKTEGVREMEPKPIAPEMAMPDFYFDLKDEQEAAKFRNKSQSEQQKKYQAVLDYLNSQVIQQSGLELPEDEMSHLRRVIDSRFRGVRNLRDVKDALIKPKNLGGVGLENEQAQKILKLIEDYRLKIGEEMERIRKMPVQKRQDSQEGRAATDNQEMEKAKEDLLKKVKPITTYIHPSYREKPLAGKIPGKVIPTSQEIIHPPTGPSRPDYGVSKFRERVKVMGPVEELSSFDLESFRALAPDTRQIIEKIKHKISLLEDESFEKKAQGIQAWQHSEVYQNYLDLGRQSLEQNRPVNEIIKDKQSQNQPTLSFEEFQAIADLNEELMD